MLSQSFSSLIQTVADIFFPVSCPGCDTALRYTGFPICPRCTFSLERADPALIRASITQPSANLAAFAHVLSLWMFDKSGVVQQIHRRLKYNNHPHVGFAMGKLIGRNLVFPIHPLRRPEIIIPIPLHKQRLLERGYNQSRLLAEGIASVTNIPLATEALARSSYTQTQTGLDHTQRHQNVQNAFCIQDHTGIRAKHILLVDDVLTTGATLWAASAPLYEAGAGEISIATLAFTRP